MWRSKPGPCSDRMTAARHGMIELMADPTTPTPRPRIRGRKVESMPLPEMATSKAGMAA